MTELSTAIHEAGHAVLSRYFKITLECVAISPACGLSPGNGATKAANRPSCEAEAVICLAGFVAERQHNPSAVSWNEFKCNSRYAADRAQLDKVVQMCLPISSDEDDTAIDKLIDSVLEKAEELVARPAIWHAITALSSKLILPPHWLSGEEAMMIIDAKLKETE